MVTIRQYWVAAAVAAVLVANGCGGAGDLVESEPSPTAGGSPTEAGPTTSSESSGASDPAAAPVPKVGECRRTDPFASTLGNSTEVPKAVPCRQTHNAQTYFVGLMNESMQAAARRGKARQLRGEVAGICGRHLSSWLGGSGAETALSVFDFVVGAPMPTEVGSANRWFSCDVYAVRIMSRLKLVALPKTTKGLLAAEDAEDWSTCNHGGFGAGASNTVICSRPHAYRGVAAIRLGRPKDTYPGSKTLNSKLNSVCTGQVRAYLNTTGSFRFAYTWPSPKRWKGGDRWGICYVKTSS